MSEGKLVQPAKSVLGTKQALLSTLTLVQQCLQPVRLYFLATDSYDSQAGTLSAAIAQQAMDPVYSRTSPNRDTSNASPSQNSLDSNHNSLPPAPSKSDSPQPVAPRLSAESANKPSSSKWQEGVSTVERRDTVTTLITNDSTSIMESFDDSILRALCDLDVRNFGRNILYLIHITLYIRSVRRAVIAGSYKAEHGVLSGKFSRMHAHVLTAI